MITPMPLALRVWQGVSAEMRVLWGGYVRAIVYRTDLKMEVVPVMNANSQ